MDTGNECNNEGLRTHALTTTGYVCTFTVTLRFVDCFCFLQVDIVTLIRRAGTKTTTPVTFLITCTIKNWIVAGWVSFAC